MDLSGLGGKDGASDNGAGEEGDCGGCWASGSSQVFGFNTPPPAPKQTHTSPILASGNSQVKNKFHPIPLPLVRCLMGYLLEVDEQHMPWIEVTVCHICDSGYMGPGPSPHCNEADPCCLWLQEGRSLLGPLLHPL